jgi:hypothetical protein
VSVEPVSAPTLACMIVAIVLLAGLGQKLYELHARGADPLRRSMCACVAALLAATAAQLFAAAIDGHTGIGHLADVISDACAMIAAHAGRLCLIYVSHPAHEARLRTRRHYLAMMLALAAVVVLFFLFPPPAEPSRWHRTDAVYLYVYILFVGITLASVFWLITRYARLAYRGSLRVGLRLIAAGAACGLAFVAVQAVMLVGDELGAALGRWDDRVAMPLELATESLVVIGAAVPAWGAQLGGAVRWVRDRRSCRLLHPLWLAMRQANPELTLAAPDGTDRRWWRRDAGFVLYRHVIEIRDGQLALRPYIDPGVAETAIALARRAGLPDEEVQIAAEAAAVAAGIAAKKQGRRRSGPPVPGAVAGGSDLSTEIAWLTKVSRAFATSPVITATLATLESCAAPRTGGP